MTARKQYWLVYYEQRPEGRSEFLGANGVTDRHPGKFLLDLIVDHPYCDNRLNFAVEIDKRAFEQLGEKL